MRIYLSLSVPFPRLHTPLIDFRFERMYSLCVCEFILQAFQILAQPMVVPGISNKKAFHTHR
jgi:hypothetical protein